MSPKAWGLVAGILVVLAFGGLLLAVQFAPKLEERALVGAAKRGDAGTVRWLLAHGADPNARPPGRRALDYAVLSGNTRIATALLDHGASISPPGAFETNPLVEAVAAGQATIVKILLDRGANPNLQDPSGMQTLLNLAFFARKPAVMQALLDGGANPNTAEKRQGTTAPMWSVRGGELAMTQDLIAHGADVNARGSSGMTVLTYAVLGGHLPLIRYVVAHGAHVNARSIGNHGPYTALMVAEEDARILKRQRDRGFASERAGLDQYVKNEEAIIQYLTQAGGE